MLTYPKSAEESHIVHEAREVEATRDWPLTSIEKEHRKTRRLSAFALFCSGITQPFKGMQSSFGKLANSPKKRGELEVDENDESKREDPPRSIRATTSDTRSLTASKPSSTHKLPPTSPNPSIGLRRCDECVASDISICDHNATQTSSEVEQRPPLPPRWVEGDEDRRLKQEMQVWESYQRALNVPAGSRVFQEASMRSRHSVMERGRPV